jgi:hypothetical protein
MSAIEDNAELMEIPPADRLKSKTIGNYVLGKQLK